MFALLAEAESQVKEVVRFSSFSLDFLAVPIRGNRYIPDRWDVTHDLRAIVRKWESQHYFSMKFVRKRYKMNEYLQYETNYSIITTFSKLFSQ